MASSERIGVVLVHGIGEQRRFEHLTNEVRDLLAALDIDSVTTSVGVRDTRDSQFAAENESWRAEKEAPVRVDVRCAGKDADEGQRKTLYIHEVWWADLDDKATLRNRVMFWFWGLAMWNAKRFERPNHCGAERMRKPKHCKPPDRILGQDQALRLRRRVSPLRDHGERGQRPPQDVEAWPPTG